MKASKKNPHILNIAPPLNMKPRWFKNHVAYTMAKYGMSMCVLGMSEEFKEYGIAVNALWPQTGKSTKIKGTKGQINTLLSAVMKQLFFNRYHQFNEGMN